MLLESEAIARFCRIVQTFCDDIEALGEEYPRLKAVLADTPLADVRRMLDQVRSRDPEIPKC